MAFQAGRPSYRDENFHPPSAQRFGGGYHQPHSPHPPQAYSSGGPHPSSPGYRSAPPPQLHPGGEGTYGRGREEHLSQPPSRDSDRALYASNRPMGPSAFTSPVQASPRLSSSSLTSTPVASSSTSALANGQSEGGSEFDRIRMDCLRRRVLFEDPAFPARDSSIYYSRQPQRPFEWKRPEEIAAYYRRPPSFVVGGVDRFDIKQGELGDCWVLASLACISSPEHRQLFDRLVPPGQSFDRGWYAGVFHFNFWHFGKWEEVIVDDLLPTQSRQLVFNHSSQPDEFWAPLVEKAYAKLYGSYEALKGGRMADAFTDFTGGVTESYKLRGEHADVPRNIVNILFKALDRQSLIGCGIDPLQGGESMESHLENGLIAGHAYSVTDLREIGMMEGSRQIPIILIRVRNPWGNEDEWKGPWGDRSQEWLSIPPEDKKKMGLVKRDDGEFWMNFHDFLRNFDTLDICNLSPDSPVEMMRRWHSLEFEGRWQLNFNAGGRPSRPHHWTNPHYLVELSDTDEDDDKVCSFLVQLMQKDGRRMKVKGEKLEYIGFLIYEVPRGFSPPMEKEFFDQAKQVADSGAFINSRQVVKRFSLSPGKYLVVPCTYDEQREAAFYVRFFFEKGNIAEFADEKPTRVDPQPPAVTPEFKEQEDKFKEFFYRISGEDMEVNPFELRQAINEGLKKDPLHRDISVDACKSFVSLMDVDGSGKLGFPEFTFLWHHLRSWKKVFYQFDTDKSGKMDAAEIRGAVAGAGFKVGQKALGALIFRFCDEDGTITLDSFLICMARLMSVYNSFQKHQKDSAASFSLEQLLEQTLVL